jgi:prepilin-type N-terminal cleavage/methylation domain-containing protein
MKKSTLFRSAFSMVELIFVIVVLGIVASIGSEIIAKVYQSYIVQRAQYSANIKTELALNQIENRLRMAIPNTKGYRVASKTDTFNPLSGGNPPANANVLQWVAYDGESFDANSTPGWSGFCDLNSSTATVIVTPGSNLGFANTVNTNLGRGSLTPSVHFPDGNQYNVSGAAGESITLTPSLVGDMWEQYKMARTSYAIVVEDYDSDGKNDLVLYYNFSPTTGAAIGGNSSLLFKGVSNFRFLSSEGSTRIKICREEEIGDGSDVNSTVHSCKEKVVF